MGTHLGMNDLFKKILQSNSSIGDCLRVTLSHKFSVNGLSTGDRSQQNTEKPFIGWPQDSPPTHTIEYNSQNFNGHCQTHMVHTLVCLKSENIKLRDYRKKWGFKHTVEYMGSGLYDFDNINWIITLTAITLCAANCICILYWYIFILHEIRVLCFWKFTVNNNCCESCLIIICGLNLFADLYLYLALKIQFSWCKVTSFWRYFVTSSLHILLAVYCFETSNMCKLLVSKYLLSFTEHV